MRRINKKGSIVDIFYIAIALTFFSISVLIGTNIAIKFHEGIADNQLFQDEAPDAITYTDQTINNYTGAINSVFLLLTTFLVIVTLTLAALVRVHPIFIPLFLLALIFLILFAGILSNVYSGVAESSEIAETVERYTIMHNIMILLPFLTGVLGIILMVVLYKTYQIG